MEGSRITDALLAPLGTVWTGESHKVDDDAVRHYATATGDDVARYEKLGMAPPVYAAVASMSAHAGLLARVLPIELLMVSLHLGQTMHFHNPLVIGETIESRATLIDSGGGSFGLTLNLHVEVFDQSAVLLAEGFHRVLIRGVRGPATSPNISPPRGLRQRAVARQLGERVVELAADQSIRYGHASGDLLPIHTDVEVATRAGFPGLILHGMCTFAMCCRAVVDFAASGDPTRLRVLSATFTRPVVVGRSFQLSVECDAQGTIGFSASQHGRSVIRDGHAEVAPIGDG